MYYRGVILLCIVGKVYGRIVIDSVRRIQKLLVSQEQDGFRKRIGCLDQIFTLRQVVEKVLETKVYATFMD